MSVPRIDLRKPDALNAAIRRFELELDCMLVWLREEAIERKIHDPLSVQTAAMFLDHLETSRGEAFELVEKIRQNDNHILKKQA